MRVGVFDSGIGGLTILKSLLENHPNNEYIYFGDTLNIPYGEKTNDQLKDLSDKIIRFLISKKVDMIVIACGTISSSIYDEIKNKYDVPIYDIINPITNQLKKLKIKKALLIATDKTIESKKFEEKLKSANMELYTQACPKFVPIIEHKSKDLLEIELGEYLYQYKNLDIEVVIPGCTHYPIISGEIADYLNVDILDIGLIVAKSLDIEYSINDLKVYFSAVDDDLKEVVKDIIGDCEIEEIKLS
ncbi:MAG: glutamate racemase [Tenericutes bacterium]|nr:glutamate racemase [Mycoplasmatota bacterium]MDY3800764.1 glutamate racemase [Bacilli bacterium]